MRASLAALWALSAGPAAAHSPVNGVEGFYTGLLHPLTTPEQILALLATGLLLGSFPLRRLAPAFAALLIGLLGGLVLGGDAAASAPSLYAFSAAVGVAAAITPGRSIATVVVAAGAAGLLLGFASLPDPGPPLDRFVTMAGSIIGVLLLILYLAGALDLLRERIDSPVVRIGLRVVAAWIAAIAVLMLALVLSPPEG